MLPDYLLKQKGHRILIYLKKLQGSAGIHLAVLKIAWVAFSQIVWPIIIGHFKYDYYS